MRVAVLFSGGKDSCFAASWAIGQGFETMLVTVEPEEYSMMFHHPNIRATKMQAEAMGLEQVFVKTDDRDWEKNLKAALKKLDARALVTGAVASTYQRTRIDNLAKELGVPAYSPLWHAGPEVMEEMLRTMEIYVSAVSAEGLGPEFLGEPLEKLVRAKKPDVHLFLEGGEGETFVANAPFFKKRIVIEEWKKTWDGVRGVAEIKKARLAAK